jgi:nucleoside-diphosphate-sugar epimerase
MKSVLIIGSTSTVGLSAGRFLAQNHKVSYAGRRQADYQLSLDSANLELPENSQFDVVIHAAADFGGNDEEVFHQTEIVNAIGTLNVCRLAQRVRAKHVIVISSAFANFIPGDPYFGIYSLSKRHADELAQLYCNKVGLPLTILRPSQLYDAESRCKSHQGLFYLIVDKAQRGEDILIHGNNDALRNYLFLDDFSEILARVVQEEATGVFNCPAPKSVRLSEIANTAYQVFNQHATIHFAENESEICDLPAVSDNGLYEKIGFEPSISLAQGIKKIKYVREMT